MLPQVNGIFLEPKQQWVSLPGRMHAGDSKDHPVVIDLRHCVYLTSDPYLLIWSVEKCLVFQPQSRMSGHINRRK